MNYLAPTQGTRKLYHELRTQGDIHTILRLFTQKSRIVTFLAASSSGLPNFTQGATCYAHDVVINSDKHERKGLLETLTSGNLGGRTGDGERTGDCTTNGCLGRRGELHTDVGELAVVGRAVRVDVQEVERIRVEVVSSLLRDGRGAVPRLDEREVVNRHVGQTLGVLVVERDLGNCVRCGGRSEVDTRCLRNWGGGRIVGPLGLVRGVLESEHERLDRVREVDVNASGVAGRVNRLRVVRLDLLNEDITRSLAHELTLVVADEGILGPHLHVGQLDVGVQEVRRGGIGGHTTRTSTTGDGGDVVNDEKVGPVAEVEAQLHLVVGQSSRRESNTRVAGVAIRERQDERGGRDDETVVGGTNGVGVVIEEGNVSDHVIVANALGRGDREGRPEIKEVVVKTHLDQIVEGHCRLLQQVVHQVARPTDARVGAETSRGGVHRHRRERHTQPVEQEVITSTRNVGIPLNTERRGLVQRQGRRHNREPSGLGDTADEVRDGLGAAVHVLLWLVVGSQIYETAR